MIGLACTSSGFGFASGISGQSFLAFMPWYLVVNLFGSCSGFSAKADSRGERIGPALSLSGRCTYVLFRFEIHSL
jgi:hypothetical protein